MIRTVISDLGKVILWFDNGIFFRKMAALCSCPEEKIREVVHRRAEMIELFDTGRITPRQFYSRAAAELNAPVSYEDFFAAYRDVFWPNPPVLELYKKLKGKYRFILLSNTDVVRFSFIKEKFPEILFFDAFVLSFEVGVMKPHPAIYREALQRAEAEASACVFIDDMEENIQAASALGFKTILYRPDTDLESKFRAAGLEF
ncbi:MAG: HAD family phosphatase [Candidatus Aminicenantes bacterium]|nr:HAD family phosphatase [Candidatus Aminicenantes bacterium]